MADTKYTNCAVIFDKVVLAEAQSEKTSSNSGTQIVRTQQKGFAGASKGYGEFTVDVTSAIPRTGLEVDLYTVMNDMTQVEMILWRGSKKLTSLGYIMSVSESHSGESAASVDFTFSGSEPEEL